MEGKIGMHASSDLSPFASEGFLQGADRAPGGLNWELGGSLAAIEVRASPGGEACVGSPVRVRGGLNT